MLEEIVERARPYATQSETLPWTPAAIPEWTNQTDSAIIQISDNIAQFENISGALTPDSKRADSHAQQYYESVRHMQTDAKRIAENTGYTEEEIWQIKQFIFVEEHELGYSAPQRFDPSFEMAQSWQRLIDGRNIQPHDLTLLRHEQMERHLMQQGLSQGDAHIIASQLYNYAREAAEYYGQIEKYRKD